MQEKGSGLGGIFGGSGETGGFYQTRRGLEKIIFIGTIVLAAAFAAIALIDLIF